MDKEDKYPSSKINFNFANINDLEKWFLNNNPQIVILAAAKVGGIFANMTIAVDFLLEN